MYRFNYSIDIRYRFESWLDRLCDSYLSFYGGAALVIYLAYFVLLTKLNHGQTIGKMIFGIRVVGFDETTELSWSTVLVREGACRFILKFPLLFIGYLPLSLARKNSILVITFQIRVL